MAKRLILAVAVVALSTAAAAAPNGSGAGRACYAAAEFHWPKRAGLKICSRALRDAALPPGERGAALVNRGIVQLHARKIAAAIADFDAALDVAPGLAEAMVNKGIALIELGREREAVALLSAGIARQPAKPAVAYYMRGVANETIGATRAAYDDYNQALALAPGWTEPAEQLRRFSVVRRKVAHG